MNNDEKILKVLEALQADVTAMKGEVQKIPAIQKQLGTVQQDIVDVKQEQAHISTALEAVAAGQREQATKQDVETTVEAAKTELKADMLLLELKVIKKIQSHERRISNIEEEEGIKNLDKN
jgi:hypothetical protein